MTEPLVFMFSGQGSHYFHMGRELFDTEPVFRDEMLRLDALARSHLGASVVETIYDSRKTKQDEFDQLSFTHPAIFMVQLALAKVVEKHRVRPDYVLGASLGTYVAAVVSGCLDEAQGLELTIRQARLAGEMCMPGGMIAVLAPPELYQRNTELRERCDIAAINFSSHFVVAAPADRLAQIERFLCDRQIVFHRLAVRRPFHSRWIESAKQRFLDEMGRVQFRRPRVPVLCCANAAPVDEVSAERCWRIVREPIRFQQTIEALERVRSCRYLDLGPSGTLGTFIKYILPRDAQARVTSIMTPFGGEVRNLARLPA